MTTNDLLTKPGQVSAVCGNRLQDGRDESYRWLRSFLLGNYDPQYDPYGGVLDLQYSTTLYSLVGTKNLWYAVTVHLDSVFETQIPESSAAFGIF